LIATFELTRPETLDSALDAIQLGGTPYCGGTELVAAMQLGLLAPETLVDLKRVGELAGVTTDGTTITIGATTRHRSVAANPMLRANCAALVTACSNLGNQRVRATGSIAGNLCFAEPRSDVMTALLALRADVVLRSTRGQRVLPLSDFVVGALETVRDEDELMVSVRVPHHPAPQVHLRFQPAEYPTVCVAVAAGGPATAPIRLVVGAVGERPHVVDVPDVAELDVAAVAGELDVTEDLNGAEDYKRHLCQVYLGRAVAAWKECADA
jgi:carbon-monoxide dehydrogenase medium subunit